MNGEALLFVSSLTQAVAYGSWNLMKWYKRQRHKDEVFCIISARHTGISTCVDSLRNDNREYKRAIIVDENDVIAKQPQKVATHLLEMRNKNQDSYMIEVFPLIRQHLQDLRSVHGSKPVVLFTSLPQLPVFLGVKPKRCLLLYTSQEFHSDLSQHLEVDGDTEECRKRMGDTRDVLLSSQFERIKYNNFGNLRRILEHLLYGRSHL